MRCVIQRVRSAKVHTGSEELAAIQTGLLIFLGVEAKDGEKDAAYLAGKIANLRVFPDAGGLMNLSVADVNGEILLVSEFTLLGDCKKGNRPSFTRAAGPEHANALYERLARMLKEAGLRVQTGRFRAEMDVSLVNHGPVTILIDSRKAF